MTTNKPKIYWAPSTALDKLERRNNNAPRVLTDGPAEFNDTALIRLSEIEALQADRDQQYNMKVKAREQRDAVTAKLNALQDRLDDLDEDYAIPTEEQEHLRGNCSSFEDRMGVLQVENGKLQAECENLRKHLQNLIDQTTPLEPVPGNPMWSRRIQLDEVIAERDSLRAECEKLRKLAAECAEYLNFSKYTTIHHGSLLHKMLIDAAMQGGNP